jgi:GT2 family glycosyltransferase
MFLDDDVLVPIDCLHKLIEAKADIAAGDVFIRGYPFMHMAFRHIKGDKHSLKPIASWKKSEPIVTPVDAVGFSCVLIKKELLKKIEKPFFITGPTNTEDIYFCMKARSVDPTCKIVIDRSIVCGHILWQEVLDNVNVKAYKKYYETIYGKPEKDETITRGPKYLKSVQEALNAK